jgi:murein DD-endopeptidase MepM/ murein hydrolase activator NlpD
MLQRLRRLLPVISLLIFAGCATAPPSALPKPPRAATAIPGEDFIWPLQGRVIAKFGERIDNAVNQGINIEPYNNYDVVAARSGRVVFLNDDFLDLGKTLILQHPDGFWTVYGRNEQVLVKIGDSVARGANIAKAGKPGRERNIYLHFEIRKGHIPHNPVFYLP